MTSASPQAVLFDLYDTLVWSDWPSHAEFLAGELDLDNSQVVAAFEDLRRQRDTGSFPDPAAVLAEVMRHCGIPADRERAARLARQEADYLVDRVVLYDDSIPTLRALRSAGIATAVVSNCSPSTRPVVDRLGLESEADAVVLSCEVGASKPDPEIFMAALGEIGMPAHQAVFVDDRGDYLDGAARLGMSTLRIERDGGWGENKPSGDHPVVADLAGVMERLAL